ncbi:MAG: cation transporter [Clostridia bacterium]|nr:cation transporter [Clostridia bacterium]
MEKTNVNKRAFYGKLASFVGIVVNVFLAVGKIIVGTLFGVISVFADGINNLTDCGSSVISIISFKLSAKPADKEHPFGHERIEYIFSLVVAFLIFFVAFETVKESFSKIIEPSEFAFSTWVLIMLAVSIVSKLCLFFYYKVMSRKIDSSILKATSIDCLTDCVSTTVVLVSFLIGNFSGVNIDGYAGVFVSLFIGYSAINILKEVFSTLIGKAPDEKLINEIRDKILSYKGVLGVHDMSVYSYGPNKYFASVHIEVDAKADVLDSHELVDLIEKEFLQSTGIVLTGHLDPIVTDDERVNTLRAQIEDILNEIDECLSLHDFRMVFGESRTNVLFDVAIPYDFKLSKEEIKALIEEKVALIDKKYCLVITIEPCL